MTSALLFLYDKCTMPQTASFDIEIQQTEIKTGEEFVVSLFIDSAFQPVNTIFARLSYPQDQLEFVDSSFSKSEFDNLVERQTEPGLIKLTSFTAKPYSGDHGLFVNLKFKPLAKKEAQVTIQPISKIHSADGKGTDIADPAQLPVVLTVFPGTEQKPIVKKGETVKELKEEIQKTALQTSQESTPFSEKGVADYSTFSGYPKNDLPSKKTKKVASLLNNPLIIIISILLLTIALTILIIKLKKKRNSL